MKRLITLFCLVLLLAASSTGQSNYGFSYSTTTYTEITGGTLLGATDSDDQRFVDPANLAGSTTILTGPGFPIGFDFTFGGVVFDRLAVNNNGWISLGHSSLTPAVNINSSSSYTPLGSTTSISPDYLVSRIAAVGRDLQAQTDASLRIETIGTTPERVCVIQWKNYRKYNATGDSYNFQIRLNEGSNEVHIVYGTMTNNATSTTVQVGLRGAPSASATNYHNRTTTTDWSATTKGVAVGDACTLSNSVYPTNGAEFKFLTPSPCSVPAAQPTSLALTPALTTIAGSFTAASGTDDYLVVRSLTNSLSANPVNGTVYAVGSVLGGGIVDYFGSGTSFTSSGLTVSTTYYYFVFSANYESCIGGPVYLTTSPLQNNATTLTPGTVTSTTTGGLWSATGTWSGGVLPTASDNVIIADGATVTIDVTTATCWSLTVGQGTSGVLNYLSGTASTLTVNAGVTIASGGSFNAGSGVLTSHALNIGGNTSAGSGGVGSLVNNGNFDMYGTAGVTVNFYGIANVSISGSGTTLDFYRVVMNKGNVTATATVTPPILEIQRDFTVQGANTVGLIYTHTAGVLKIGGSFTQSNPLYVTVGYTIPALGGLWLDNANFTVTGQNGSPTLSGLLKVTNGTLNIGTVAGNSMGFNTGSIIRIEGGSVNASGRFGVGSSSYTINYSQSGGAVTVCQVGNTSTSYASFDLGTSATSIVSISGGTIAIQIASTAASGPRDYRGPATGATLNITGGNLYLGNASSPGSAQTYYVQGVAPNFTLTSTTANHNCTLAGELQIRGDLTLNSTGIFSLSTLYNLDMRGMNATYPGNIVNNGTMTLNAGTTQKLTFSSSSGNQTFTNNGTISGPNQLGNVTINNTFGGAGTVNLPNGLAMINGSTLTMTKGILNVGTGLTLGNAGTGIFSVVMTDGTFSGPLTFNFGTGTVGYTYNGTAVQVTGSEIPASISGTLTINNTNGVTLGSALSAGFLTLTAGPLITSNANLLTVTANSTGSVSRTSGYVNGPLARTLPITAATGTWTYPLGTSTNYLPFEITDPTTGATSPVIKVEMTEGNYTGTPGTLLSGLNNDRRWAATLISGNFTSSKVKITDPSVDATKAIAFCSTINGTFNGTPTTNTGTTMTSMNAIALDNYYAVGTKSPMSYVSSTTTQTVFTDILQGATNQQIIGVQVVMTGSDNPLPLNSLTFNTNGSTNGTNNLDIVNAKLYSTGTSSTFATTTQIGATVTDFTSGGVFTINPVAFSLVEGTNYFWLTYDIQASATNNDVVDAECTSLTINSSVQTPTVTAPAGNRAIFTPTLTVFFHENFEDAWTIPSTIDTAGWTCPQTGNNEWHRNDYTTGWTLGSSGAYSPTGANSTSYSARFHSYYASSGTIGELITPAIDFSSNSGIMKLDFYYINTSGTDKLDIYFSTDNGSTWSSSLQQVTTATAWTLYTVIIGNSTSAQCKIKFTATSDYGYTDIGVDQVKIYNLTSPTMRYFSCTSTQTVTTSVNAGSKNQQVIGIEVVTSGEASPISVSKFTVNANGCTLAGDADTARIFYTGTSSAFATTTQFGVKYPNPTISNFDITGTQQLLGGTNYFWLAYDIDSAAVNNNLVDGECQVITIGGADKIPLTKAPVGTRAIVQKTINSVTVAQASIAKVGTGSSNNPVLRVDISVSGPGSGKLYLSSLTATSTCQNDADIASNGVKLYRTSSTTFSTADPLGTAQSLSGGTATFSGLNYNLPAGTTYIWVTYDISSGATEGNTVDAKITANSISIGTLTYPSTDQDPAGNRQIANPLAGTKNIGSGGDFTSLTRANGLFAAINEVGLSGNLIANITSDITDEDGTVALNQWSEAGAGNYTVTIQPSSASSSPTYTVKTISGSYSGGLIRLNGADRVNIDGRISGDGNYLTFSNTSTAANSAAFHLISLGAGLGAENNTIRNCNISAGSNSETSTFGIYVGGTSVSTSGTGADNDNLSIIDNIITKAYFAIYARGVSGTGLLNNLLIEGNTIGSDIAAEFVTYHGVDIQNASAPVISQNEIFNLQLTTSVNVAGIDLGQYVTDANVNRNEIHGLKSTSTGGWGAYGINISSSSGTANININNNLIYDLITDGDGSSTTWNPYGIRITGGTNHKIYYNSVNLFGTFTNTTTADYSAAFILTSSSITGVDLRDNIFVNSMTGGTGAKSFSVYVPSGTTFGTIDHNDYYVSGVNGVFGYFGADIADLAAWQLATGQDANSLNTDPLFTSNTDLHVSDLSPVVSAGIPITDVDYDFDNTNRNDAATTIGAYEILQECPNPAALSYTDLAPYSVNLTWTPTGDESTWKYAYGVAPFAEPEEGDPVITTNSSVSNPVTGLLESTTYQYWVMADCGGLQSGWAGPKDFTTTNTCPQPTPLPATYITTTTADINWTPGGNEYKWSVKVGPAGYVPGAAMATDSVVGTENNSWTATLEPSTEYNAYIQANCGFETPKVDYFFFAQNSAQEFMYGGGYTEETETGETLQWLLYDLAPEPPVSWYNIWFYNDPLDPTRMKIIRMGFWVKPYEEGTSDIYYVFNWSNELWNNNGAFPLPTEESSIERSPVNYIADITEGADPEKGKWIEIEYIIPDYNPAWISVDIWGQNIQILNEQVEPPMESPLLYWWSQNPQKGGILVHECLPKPMGDASGWAGPVFFQTLCGPNALPLSEKFDGVTTPALPYCWSKLVNSTSTYSEVATTSTYSYSNPNSVSLYNSGDGAATLLLISPEISSAYPMSGNMVTFRARGSSTGYSVIVGVMSDPADAATFTPVSTLTLTAAFAEYVVELDEYLGSGHYLAFKHGTASTYTTVYVDDVLIETIPSCKKPTSLSASNLQQTSADLSWTAGQAEILWQVKYGPVNFNPLTQGSLVTGIGLPLPFTLGNDTPLAPNTAYHWYVRGICAEGDTSAWAGPGSFTTLVSPAFTYTPLPNTHLTGPVTLTANILGAGGIPQAGDGLPRVCWKNGTEGTWAYVTGSYVSENQYSFTFGGGAQGETIYYFLVAQDNVIPLPNVLASPSAGAGNYSSDPPAAGTPPTTPHSYTILQAMSGIYTVGTDQADDFSSLTGTGGIFSALNNSVIIGPVHVQITSSIAETGATALNALNYPVDSFFDVFFEIPPSGGRTVVVISGNYAGGLIRLNGADHVTFDGGLAKELTVRNYSTSASSVFQLSNGASWNTIVNCNIGCGSNTATTYGIVFIAATGNDHNTIEGNNIFRSNQGIAIPGSSTNDGISNKIMGNLIGSEVDSLQVYTYGINATYQTNFVISGNEIKNIINSTLTPPIAINTANCNSTAITGNYIHDILYTGTGGYGAHGINVNADEGSTVSNPQILISNNVIRHITGDGDVPSIGNNWVPTGIRILGNTAVTQGISVYYNSVYLTNDPGYGVGNATFDTEGSWCAAISVEGVTGVNVVNNAFFNKLGERASYSQPSYGVAIWAKSATSPFGVIDHNVYFSESFDVNIVGMVGTSTTQPFNSKTLAEWQTFTGQDAHSVFMNPNFQNNLLEFTGGSSYAIGGGTPLTTIITEDYDGDFRDEMHPTIGAHEYGWQAAWTNSATPDNSWFNGNNWSSGVFPWYNMTATIPSAPSGGLLFPVIATGQTATLKTVTVENGAAVTVQTGGALNVTEP